MRQVQQGGASGAGSPSWAELATLPSTGSVPRPAVAALPPVVFALMLGVIAEPASYLPHDRVAWSARAAAAAVAVPRSAANEPAIEPLVEAPPQRHEAPPRAPARSRVPNPQIARPVALESPALAAEPALPGALDPAIIRRYLRRFYPRLRYCYQQQLDRDPALTGTVQLQFHISSDGRVTASTAQGFDATMDGCVADVIRDIEFPRSGSGSEVSYPLHFVPGPG